MLTIVKKYESRVNAEIGKKTLEIHGVRSQIQSDDAGGMRPDVGMASGGVNLLVQEDELQEAQNLLSNEED